MAGLGEEGEGEEEEEAVVSAHTQYNRSAVTWTSLCGVENLRSTGKWEVENRRPLSSAQMLSPRAPLAPSELVCACDLSRAVRQPSWSEYMISWSKAWHATQSKGSPSR